MAQNRKRILHLILVQDGKCGKFNAAVNKQKHVVQSSLLERISTRVGFAHREGKYRPPALRDGICMPPAVLLPIVTCHILF